MPEHVSGRFSDAAYGDTLQWISTALARVEARQELMERTLAALAAQVADLDECLRRAADREREAAPSSPRRRTRSPGRRGDTILRVVQAAVIALVGLATAAWAVLAPAPVKRDQDAPPCAVACARPVVHVDFDHDGDAR